MTDSEQIRIFFQKMAAGANVAQATELLHKKNNRLPRTAFRVSEMNSEFVAERSYGVTLPPLAGC